MSSHPLHRYISNPQSLGLVLASVSGGGPTTGTQQGPSTLLSSGLLDRLRPHFTEISISEIATTTPTTNDPKTISTTAHRIFHQVHAHTLHGRLALTLGGCHTSTIGTLTATTAALQQTQNQRHQHSPPIHSTTTPAVIILDAHLALNTPSTSPSGNLNGMPLAYATGVAGAATTDSTPDAPFSWIQQAWRVDFRRLVYIGTRDVDPPERDVVARHAIKVFGMEEVRRHGIEKIMDAVFAYLGPETPIHLSVNVDALDPRWAPGTGNPVEGGLSLEDGKCVARRVRDSGNLVAVDVVEVDPTVTDREGVERTVRAAAWLVRCALTEC